MASIPVGFRNSRSPKVHRHREIGKGVSVLRVPRKGAVRGVEGVVWREGDSEDV